MLIGFVVEDLEDFKVFSYIFTYDDWYLNIWTRIIVGYFRRFRIEFYPIVNRILHVANPISIAKNLQPTSLPWVIESLQLFITVVFHEIGQILINCNARWFGPLQRLNIDKSVQVVNAEAQINSITRCDLNFILGNSRHTVWNMDPCTSCLSPWFDDVKSIGVVIHNFLALSVFFLPSLGSKYHRISSKIASSSYISRIALRVLSFIPVHIFKLECFANILHHLKAISSKLNFQNSINSQTFLISKFSRWKNQFSFD